jgi:hypothetical protein
MTPKKTLFRLPHKIISAPYGLGNVNQTNAVANQT